MTWKLKLFARFRANIKLFFSSWWWNEKTKTNLSTNVIQYSSAKGMWLWGGKRLGSAGSLYCTIVSSKLIQKTLIDFFVPKTDEEKRTTMTVIPLPSKGQKQKFNALFYVTKNQNPFCYALIFNTFLCELSSIWCFVCIQIVHEKKIKFELISLIFDWFFTSFPKENFKGKSSKNITIDKIDKTSIKRIALFSLKPLQQNSPQIVKINKHSKNEKSIAWK